MGGILSQDEVDALLKNFVSAEGEKEEEEEKVKPEERSGAVEYDLTSQGKMVGYRMPALDIIFERFSRSYRTTLSTLLRRNVDMNITATNTITFGELVKSLPVPTSLHIFRVEPLEGCGLLVIQSELVFALIDILFGGKGTSIRLEGREFTAIETRVVKRFRDALIKDLEASWRPVYEVSCHHLRSEVNPQFVWIVPPEDPIYTVVFEVEVEETSGDLTLVLPYSMLQPIKDKLMAAFLGTDEAPRGWSQRIQPLLMEAKVNVVAELASTFITCGDLINLKEGDVIPIDKTVQDPLSIKIEGVPKYLGYSGQHRGSTAIQIASVIKRR